MRWMCGALLLAGLGLGRAVASDVSEATAWFHKGNQAYEQGHFTDAAADYQKAVDLGVANAHLDYNYGDALYRLNKLGPAVLYYERAHKLDPTDADIEYNLRFAKANVADKVPEPAPTLLTRLLWKVHTAYTARDGLWAAFALYALLFAFATLAVLVGGVWRGLAWTGGAGVLLVLLVLTPSLVYKIDRLETVHYGVVLDPAIDLYSGPGDNYQVLAKVHEGTEFEIVEEHGDWLSVKLANGQGGFVRANQLGKV